MLNLLVIHQFNTLYLGGNHVRVVCERIWKIQMCERVWKIQVCVQSRGFSHLELASDLRLMTRQSATHDSLASWGTTGQKGQSCQSIIWRLKLATCPSCKWVARTPCFAEKWLFTFLTYPTINTLIPIKCKVFLERILRNKS